MFDLRNMPYTTGRVLSWSEDLALVASPKLKEFVQVQEGDCLHYLPWFLGYKTEIFRSKTKKNLDASNKPDLEFLG